MTLPGYDAWLESPYMEAEHSHDVTQTKCLGAYPETATDDAFECEDRSVCYMCAAVVCSEHDEVDDCDGAVVHHQCHKHGCMSNACNEDRRDDALLAQAGM